MYLAGLAEVWQARQGGGVPARAAVSSPVDTVSSSDPTPERVAELGFQTRTEGVPS